MKTNDTARARGNQSELLVALDLSRRGYEVYYSMVGTTTYDFIVLKDGCLQRVEVKTKKYYLAESSKEVQSMKGKADILAMVVNDEIIYYGIEG